MQNFIIKTLDAKDITKELIEIGFDGNYVKSASDKFLYKNIKIFNLTPAQANIIKQTALSLGADCATNKNVITGEIDKSNVILGGSYSELKKISEKLAVQPFSLSKLGEEIVQELKPKKRTTKIAGIVNITPDSFSDGGLYFKPKDAILHIENLISDGADIIDIGAESTKPFSEPVSSEEQIKRLSPILKEIQNFKIPISVDTRNSDVADYALNNGVSIINDVSGFDFDKKIADTAAKYNAGVIIQHSKGTPENMQKNPEYNDVVEEIYLNLLKKTEFAQEKGIKNIIIDPGIGFGKTIEHNFEILNRIEEFFSLNLPIMVGVSRKSFLRAKNESNEIKDSLTLAVSYPLIQKGVDFLRVHNVKLHRQLLNLTI